MVSIVTRLRARLQSLVHELAKFGTVGAAAFVVDVTIFNALLTLGWESLTAKAAATAVAATFAYFGNRHWSFKDRAYTGLRREYVAFIAITVVGLGIQLAVLWTSHYLLGFTSRLADNVAGNGVGMVLATTFRYLAYKRWVFLSHERAAARSLGGGTVPTPLPETDLTPSAGPGRTRAGEPAVP